MKRAIVNLIVIVYVIIAIVVTLCLLNYNDYNVTEFGNNTLILIADDSLEPEYVEGDLVIATKENLDKVEVGDKIFFYNDRDIKLGEVNQINEYGKNAHYIPNFNECVDFIKKNVKNNDIVLTLGAGTVTQIGPMIIK